MLTFLSYTTIQYCISAIHELLNANCCMYVHTYAHIQLSIHYKEISISMCIYYTYSTYVYHNVCTVCSDYYRYDIHTYEYTVVTVHLMHIMVYICTVYTYVPLIVTHS